MIYLVLGLVLFLGVHSVSIIAPAWRDRIAARLGNAWRGIYSLITIAGFDCHCLGLWHRTSESGGAIRATGLDSLRHGRSHASCVYIVSRRVFPWSH